MPAAKGTQGAAHEGWKSRIVGEGDVAPDQLLAREATGRVARCMELNPKYAQVVIERWQEYTGLTAEKLP